jgi:hypothetical protein
LREPRPVPVWGAEAAIVAVDVAVPDSTGVPPSVVAFRTGRRNPMAAAVPIEFIPAEAALFPPAAIPKRAAQQICKTSFANGELSSIT